MRLVMVPVLVLMLLGLPSSGPPGPEDQRMGSAASCPAWFEDAPRLGPGRPAAVVLGGVESVTICRYHGNANLGNGPGLPPNNKLENEKMIERKVLARSMARMVDRLTPYPSGRSQQLCSNEFGGGFWLRFGYRDGRTSSVEVVPSGCPRAIAGKHGGWLSLSYRLHRTLDAVVPASR